MNRLRRVVNGLLILASVSATFYIAVLADQWLGRSLVARLWPGPMGLLYLPGTEEASVMTDYSIVERINSLGFRDNEVALQKQHTFRIVAIGDSFTYGWGVNLEDAWCKKLERNLRDKGLDVEVLNLGKPAAGPDDYARIAEGVIPLLKPDLVIVGCLAGNDINQLPEFFDYQRFARTYFPNFLRLIQIMRLEHSHESPQPWKHSADDVRTYDMRVAQELVESMGPAQRKRFDAIEEPIRKEFFKGRLNPWLLNHSTSDPDDFMTTLNRRTMHIKAYIMSVSWKRIKKAAARVGADVLVLSIPEGIYVNKEALRNVGKIGFNVCDDMLTCDTPDEAVAQACIRAKVKFGCVTPEFRKHMDEKGLYYPLDRHFSPAGNALFADLVTPLVAKAIIDAASN